MPLCTFHRRFILLSLIASILLCACSDEYNGQLQATTQPQYLNIQHAELRFPSAATSQNSIVTSYGTSWKLTAGDSWVSVAPATGNSSASVSFKVQEYTNYNVQGRNTSVRLSPTDSDLRERTVTIFQESPALVFQADRKEVTLEGKNGQSDIRVTSNSDWDFDVFDSWLHVTRSGNQLQLQADDNATGASRSTYISVISTQAGVTPIRIRVDQKAQDIQVSSQSLSFGYHSASDVIRLTTGTAWEVRNNTSWISVNPMQGQAGTNIPITVTVTDNTDKNPRTGSFTLAGQEVMVSQGAAEISAGVSSLNFIADGETQKIQITANTRWKAVLTYQGGVDDWLTVSPKNGENNGQVTLTASTNHAATRSAQLQFVGTDGIGSSGIIQITQNEGDAQTIVLPNHLPSQGGSQEYTHSVSQSWTAEVTGGKEWLHVSPASGSASTNLVFTADATTDIAERTGSILLTYGNGLRYLLMVSQQGMGISASATRMDFFAHGGKCEPITVNAVGQVDIQCPDKWLTAQLSANLLVLTAEPNLTGKARQTTVTLKAAGTDNRISISVRQASQHADITINGYEGDDANLINNENNGHRYVDLGLSVKWATCNIGASQPYEAGSYFAWGETETKEDFTWATYKWCNGSATRLTKYNKDADFGNVDNISRLQTADDAARKAWGGTWRLPTLQECYELTTLCTQQWTTQNAVPGLLITGPNGNTIFLPAGGEKVGDKRSGKNVDGWYWTSVEAAACHIFSSAVINYNLNWDRSRGLSIRPVCP